MSHWYWYSNQLHRSTNPCRSVTPITAVLSHDMNHRSVRTISLNIKMITPPYIT
jgi:hypothetical protein